MGGRGPKKGLLPHELATMPRAQHVPRQWGLCRGSVGVPVEAGEGLVTEDLGLSRCLGLDLASAGREGTQGHLDCSPTFGLNISFWSVRKGLDLEPQVSEGLPRAAEAPDAMIKVSCG